MPEHINVVSYLLGAIVFSVGFLSARLHATADAQRAEANNASWRIREILARNERLAPDELTGLLPIVAGRTDSIAQLLRWMNGLLVVGSMLVVFDFLRLVVGGNELSPNSPFLISVLGISCLAVGIVGEADARHLNHSTRAALDQTTIGHIARLEANLRAHDLDRADIELEQLRRAFPGWGLLIEAQALIALRRDDPEQSIRMVQEHLAGETGEPYLSATVGCAAAMELGEPGRALTVLGLVQAKRPLTSVEQRLRDALRLRAGHLDLLLAGGLRRTTEPRRGEMASADAYEIRVLANIGADYLVHARERSALDLQPADEVILRELLTALARWDERGAKMAEGDARSPFDELVRISEEEQISDAMFARLGALAADADGETIESIGFFLLVGGRARDAVESLERAVRMRPRSSRAHWALAVGSWLWGWEDKAQESLERAVALDPEDLLLVATRRRFLASASEVQETLDLVAESNEWSAIQTVQLALLGIGLAPAKVSDSSTPHERFHARVTAMALASTPDDAVSTGD